MPPKAKTGAPSKKNEQKRKDKIVEDKTFGLKNKKGTKQQKFIAHVTNQVQQTNQKKSELLKSKKELEKKAEEQKLQFLISKPVNQVVKFGVDPKSLLCQFFKAGMCKKGDKCKFSHDLAVARKTEKRNVYEHKDDDDMDDWDDAKLAEVIAKKHDQSNSKITTTEIVCKFFVDALEASKYGWFWECPNGKECKYKHTLPPGFILKKDKIKVEKIDKISLEELIEKERAALNSQYLTKVNLTSFLKWKEQKKREKAEKDYEQKAKKQKEYKSGNVLGISGREMFEFNPELQGGDDANASGSLVREVTDAEEDDLIVKEIRLNELKELDIDVEHVTISTRGLEGKKAEGNDKKKADTPKDGDGGEPAKKSKSTNGKATKDGAPAVNIEIDENLFDCDDLEDIEDELNDLEIET